MMGKANYWFVLLFKFALSIYSAGIYVNFASLYVKSVGKHSSAPAGSSLHNENKT